MQKDESIRFLDFVMIALGCCLYGLGLAVVNIPNNLAEGGITGVTLILRALLGIDPALSTILINIPLIFIGYRFLGKRSLIYTIFGTFTLSFWLYVWQRVPISLDIHHDMFIAGILAGIAGGFGSGIVYRFGGTTGGTDVVARILEKRRGIAMGHTLFALDAVVLTISLCYIDVLHMMYTLLAAYVFSRLVSLTQVGAYAAHGLLIVSSKNQEIADALMDELERGASYIHMSGAYSKTEREMVYCVIGPNELNVAKRIIGRIDPQAFTSIIDVHEAIGEGFTYDSPSAKNRNIPN
ncbi:MAG: YitT family protein [Pediococcus pentosaceus]|jgi:uncharacterized membrane-anchored protein YitT (DUF2179 family)|uniref:YitT family protein n=1 Tax=Pediococcus pentosaceus TaxID=1255 RepID=UPI0003C3381E|nr:YitT family protein [Pediococcus pentosaceus]AHA05170.1 membrane protein [Pediococcus pentosaceus SL4]KAF0524367.1 DUF2179 domain-containing protein [Pediococcus pentosaceus]MCD5256816.1 YitT family protein [Pediococcus pentosaceus]MCH3988793.1 YitT family protein [Pediococcus pentosaceus]MCH4016716.1 YitT family protein [Pediococcus pentosaceus]